MAVIIQSAINRDHISPAEFQEIYAIPVATLASWRCRGQGPPFSRLGRSIRYKICDIEKWIEANRVDFAIAEEV